MALQRRKTIECTRLLDTMWRRGEEKKKHSAEWELARSAYEPAVRPVDRGKFKGPRYGRNPFFFFQIFIFNPGFQRVGRA